MLLLECVLPPAGKFGLRPGPATCPDWFGFVLDETDEAAEGGAGSGRLGVYTMGRTGEMGARPPLSRSSRYVANVWS